MEPLLQMRNIPISIEYKINKARYEIASTEASAEVTQGKHGLEMHMKPIKLNLDNIKATYASGTNDNTSSVGNFVRKGVKATYEATKSYTEESNMMLNISIQDNPIPEIALKKFNSDVSFNLGFVSAVSTETSWEPQELTIKYEIDKLNFDWKIKRPEINFIPGNIEFIIKEYPRLEINYIGKPIYVPASADPDYKPIDTFA